jgi:hypothetical protein
MTTQVVYCQLISAEGSIAMLATCTDDVATELLDETASKSLGRIYGGHTITAINGSYAAGGCMVRVRSRRSGGVTKMLEFLSNITEEDTQLIPPFQINYDDIIEAFTEAAPT